MRAGVNAAFDTLRGLAYAVPMRRKGLRLAAAAGVLLAGACAGDGENRATRRIAAFREIATAEDASGVPLLIEGLTDPDEAVRLFAARALRDVTGVDAGYRADMPPAERAQRARLYLHWRKGQPAIDAIRRERDRER
jgi:hypothetical protein